MTLTQISTDGVKDDAVTAGKIPANAVGSSELADNAVDTAAIVDAAVTNAKIGDNAISTAKISNGQITGGKMANSAVGTNQLADSAVTTAKIPDDAITTAKIADDAITQAKINVPLSNRNLIINGAMRVNQRGTLTGEGYLIDRMRTEFSTLDENPTTTQGNVSSGTTPYSLGFRNTWKIQNGNQTSSAANDARIALQYKIEAQDLANSGWNYTSSSSYITLSLWVKSSVSQNFYGIVQTYDGTQQNYPFETGTLTAGQWTKITKTIPGNSNLQFDDDIGTGLKIEVHMIRGTVFTDNSVSLNTWAAYTSQTRTPDQTTTWYSTNDATFEITGIQLEVGDTATVFESKSFAEELALCQRYCYVIPYGGSSTSTAGNEEHIQSCHAYNASAGTSGGAKEVRAMFTFPQPMRSTPTYTGSNTNAKFRASNSSNNFQLNGLTSMNNKTTSNIKSMTFTFTVGAPASMDGSTAGTLEFNAAGGFVKFETEV